MLLYTPSVPDYQPYDGRWAVVSWIEGHRFECDNNVPDEIRDYVSDLSESNVKYSDVPAEYLKYEVKYDPWAETDNVIIDGHVFAVNYDVPADATTALIELAKREGAQYSDVPRAYRTYEDPTGGWVRDTDFSSSAITYVPCDTDEEIPDDNGDDEDDGTSAGDKGEGKTKKREDEPREGVVQSDKSGQAGLIAYLQGPPYTTP